MKHRHQISIRSFFLVIFVVSIVTTIFLFSFFINKKVADTSRHRILEGDAWLISQLCETVSYLSEQAENLSAGIAFDSDIQSAMISYEYGEGPDLDLDQLRIRINNTLFYKSRSNHMIYDCVNIILFSNNGELIGSKEPVKIQTNAKKYPWFDQAARSDGKSIWLPLGYDSSSISTAHTLTIPIVRKIFSTQSRQGNTLNELMTVGKELGYVVVYIDASIFSDIVADDLDIYTKRFIILDENDRIVSCRSKEEIGETFSYEESGDGYILVDGEDFLCTSTSIENRGWKYLCLTHRSEVMRDANFVVSVCVILGIILVLLFTGIGIALSRGVAGPLHVLEEHFRCAKSGDPTIEERSFISEFTSLYTSFNSTMDEIHALADQVYEDELIHQELVLSNKESKIQALQMQINPHFLYNTLDSINWKAQIDGNKEVAEMIRILGKFFRSNIEGGDKFTTLRAEIDNIELYMTLSKFRFGSRLRFYIDIDEDLYDCQVMKLLLQPLVENSIKHGLETEAQDETIWIWCGAEEDDLVITIRDNGKGMAPQKLAYLRGLWESRSQTYRETESIGLYNVMRRLYLCYRDDCDLEIFSTQGEGTEIVITFPMRTSPSSDEPA